MTNIISPATTARKRLLVLRFSALGDVAMTLPVIYSLAERYPDLDITVTTRPFFAKLFLNPPANVTVIGVDFKGEYKGFGGTVRLLKMLSALKPDFVADLHNVSRSWIIDFFFRLKGVKVAMVDKQRSKRKRLFTSGERQRSFIDRYVDVFASLGFPVTTTFKSLFAEKKWSLPMTVEHPAVGVAPFARYFNKAYPAAQMKEAIRKLCEKGCHVYLFGGRGAEAEQMKEWADEIDRCSSVAGLYPIAEELALMAEMDVMVSMDSANQHMAAIAGTEVVTVWGSTTPACGFLGYNRNEADALCLNLECQPCSVAGKPECPLGHFKCMKDLKPDAVVNKVMEVVGRDRK